MAGANKARVRWEMAWDELAVSIGDGQPGSPDFEHGLAVLNARIGLQTERSGEASTRLLEETIRLRRATWAMAWGTIALVLVAIVTILVN